MADTRAGLSPDQQTPPQAPEQAPEQASPQHALREGDPYPGDETDFAAEHDDTSFAGDQAGGPERRREPESPTGHAGMD